MIALKDFIHRALLCITAFYLSGFSQAKAESAHLLLHAVCEGDPEIVDLMVQDGKDLNAPTWGFFDLNALDLALSVGHWRVVEKLLENNVEPRAQTFNFPCDRDQMKKICNLFPRFKRTEGCRAAFSNDRWLRSCGLREGWGRECAQVLSGR